MIRVQVVRVSGHYHEYGVMTTKVGFGSYQYQLAEGWPKLPRKGVASDVAIDSKGMAYVALRASTIFPICSSARSYGLPKGSWPDSEIPYALDRAGSRSCRSAPHGHQSTHVRSVRDVRCRGRLGWSAVQICWRQGVELPSGQHSAPGRHYSRSRWPSAPEPPSGWSPEARPSARALTRKRQLPSPSWPAQRCLDSRFR